MTNIRNSFGLGFQSVKCLDHLWCQNDSYSVFFQFGACNKVDWNDDLSQVPIPNEIVSPPPSRVKAYYVPKNCNHKNRNSTFGFFGYMWTSHLGLFLFISSILH